MLLNEYLFNLRETSDTSNPVDNEPQHLTPQYKKKSRSVPAWSRKLGNDRLENKRRLEGAGRNAPAARNLKAANRQIKPLGSQRKNRHWHMGWTSEKGTSYFFVSHELAETAEVASMADLVTMMECITVVRRMTNV
jgi:hypothetical protein